MAELTDEIRSFVAVRVTEGFESEEGIIESALETFEVDDENEAFHREVIRFTAEKMAEHRRAQSLWESPTDCDRLDWAFEELNRAGIVARQNFTCCSTCGHYEIGDEIEQAQAERSVEGYVFYHMQDTESACEAGYLYLAYGAVEEGEGAMVAVGRKIVLALEGAGLRTEWNGQGDTRIHVSLNWQRRR
ncbi:MAG TPA: hypothetical protein VN688_30815 [Gemmataceae bacterium]|nr:hypothetical protein [Gemmataceae bacterium]